MSHTNEPLGNCETYARNSTYISKATQNTLSESMKNYMQGKIDEMNQQQFGLIADKVKNSANWEQLGIIV